MGRAPCCDKANVKRGPWSPEEDTTLKNYLESHGTGGNWIALPQKAGLRRCGKSCRLRWLNYLRPDIKHGGFTEQEDNIICSLYITIGSRWSVIAAKLPGRTDNDVKNYWNTKLKKKFLAGKISSSSVPTPPSSHHHHQPTSTQSVKLENYGFSNSHLNQLNSSAVPVPVPLPMNTDFRQNSNSQRLVSDPTHSLFLESNPTHSQFSIISLPSSANASSAASSYYQEVISAEASPSVLQPSLTTFENNYSFWSGNGIGINGTDHQDADGFFMDFGFSPSSYDFLYDLGFQYHQEKSSTSTETVVASNSANTSSTLLYANLLAANSTTTTATDTKPQQGLYQSVRN